MVSIVLVTYNRPNQLKLSIQDILNQSYKNFELIICDDFSTDDHTMKICRKSQKSDNRITYIRQIKNLGMPANLNEGLKLAKYEFIAILHDGDRFNPFLIEKWLNGILQSNKIGLCFTTLGYLNEKNKIASIDQHFLKTGVVKGNEILENIYFRRPMMDSIIWGEAMFRRKIIDEIGLFDNKYSYWADVDYWMKILVNYDAFYTAEPLISMPSKVNQPNLFKIDRFGNYFMFLEMYEKHKRGYFKDDKLSFYKEYLIGIFYSLYSYSYQCLITVKNSSIKNYMKFGKKTILAKRYYLLIVWLIIFIVNLIYKLVHFGKNTR